jgi:hypothetical protein
MTTYIDSHIINLTSNTATTLNNDTFLSDTYFEFRGLLKDEPDIIKRQISLVSAQIPVSFYNVNYTNNTIVFKKSEDGSFTTATIPAANYNGNTFITALVSLFLTALSASVTITLSKTTGVITITRSTLNFSISPLSTCYELLGLKKGTTYTSASSILTAPFPINLLGVKTLQIKSPSLITQNFSSFTKTHNTLLATFSVDATLFGQINYHNYSDLRSTFMNVDLNGIDIQFYDENDKFINYNNVNWSITLAIHLTRLIPVFNPTIPIVPILDEQTKSLAKSGSDGETKSLEPKKDNVLSILE